MIRIRWQFGIFATLIFGFQSVASGMEVGLKLGEPEQFIDRAATLTVVVSECDANPRPDVRLTSKLPDGVTMNLVGVNSSVGSTFSINGRVVQQGGIYHQFEYHVTSSNPGKVTIGPFEATQGNDSAKSESVTLDFQDVDTDPNMLIQIVLPEHKIYVGQRVPIKIEWGYAGGTESVTNLRIRSPLFDRFQFEDQPARRNQQSLVLQTSDGFLRLPYVATRREIDGKEYVVATMKRTLIAEKPGVFDLDPIVASIEKVTRWRRASIFDNIAGGRRAAASKPLRALGKRLKLHINPLPPGAPESFAGAVGSGFKLDVDILGSTIVNVGDPIKLKLTVQGKGNLEQAGFPRLFAEGGLTPEKFRLPNGEVTGKVSDRGKEFVTSIRVVDQSVNQIPALAYSWFDPAKEEYQTTRSEPRSLTVGEAQIVSANSVVSSAQAQDSATANETNPRQTAEAGSNSQAGADLAIQMDRDRLFTRPGNANSYTASFLYLLGLAIVAVGFVASKKRQVDPELTSRRKNLQDAIEQIRQADSSEMKDFASQVSTALRSVLPFADSNDRSKVDKILADLDTIVYAPERHASGELEHDVRASAIDLIQTMVRNQQ